MMTAIGDMTRVALTLSKRLMVALLVFMTGLSVSRAGTKTWNAADGDWFDGTKWMGGVPGPADDAVIANVGANVQLTNSTSIGALTLSKTLVFSNWNTTLTVASNVAVQSGGTITLPAAFTDGAMSNRVAIVCSNDFVVETGGLIDADAKGYAGGATIDAAGNGPGKGAAYSGGGYGGKGGRTGGSTYGSSNAPVDSGSGGGAGNTAGTAGHGGGAIWIQAAGGVTVNGTIRANGGSGGAVQYCGGGSGGSIYISCNTFAGANGVIQANGGSGGLTFPNSNGGAGGGGRIAIVYNTSAQNGVPAPAVSLSTSRGIAPGYPAFYGEMGTIWLSDSRVLQEVFVNADAQLFGFTAWSLNNLTLSNSWIKLPPGAVQTSVTNNLSIMDIYGRLDVSANSSLSVGGNLSVTNGRLYISNNSSLSVGGNLSLASGRLDALTNGALSVGGNFVMTNSASLYVYSGPTNAASTNYGALMNISGDVAIGDTCWIYPYSDSTNGGSPLFRMRNLTILNTNAGFNADAKGFFGGGLTAWANAYGYGYGQAYAGGGYGGKGGNYGGFLGGSPYGTSNAPVYPGSGGGPGDPGLNGVANGGGLVRIEAVGTITMNGTITANGASGLFVAPGPGGNSRGGGGSGGGIYIACRTFAATNGVLNAAGGNGADTYGGGGGGGRIAVWRVFDTSSAGSMSTNVQGGAKSWSSAATPGDPGTVFWGWLHVPGTVIVIR